MSRLTNQIANDLIPEAQIENLRRHLNQSGAANESLSSIVVPSRRGEDLLDDIRFLLSLNKHQKMVEKVLTHACAALSFQILPK